MSHIQRDPTAVHDDEQTEISSILTQSGVVTADFFIVETSASGFAKRSVNANDILVADSVFNSKLSEVAANTVKCKVGPLTGNPQDLAIGASTLLGRDASSNLKALSTTEIEGFLALTGDVTGDLDTTVLADGVVEAGHVLNHAPVASGASIGTPMIVHHVTIAGGANGDVDVGLTDKLLIYDFQFVQSGAAGTAPTLQLKDDDGNIITNPVAVAGAATDVYNPDNLTAANWLESGNVEVETRSGSADFPAGDLFIFGYRSA